MTVAEALAVGEQHHRAGRADLAADVFRQILRAVPDHPPALFRLGAACQDLGQLIAAEACYQRLMVLLPHHPAAHREIALLFHRQGKLAEAGAAYRRTLELTPDDAEAWNNLGVAHKGMGQTEQAISCYERALSLQPAYPDAHNNLGVALKEEGKLDDAARCYREAVRLKPDYAQAHSNLGNLLRQMGQPLEAVACYHRALRLLPDYADGYYNLAAALMDLKRGDEAEAALRNALRLRPGFAEALNNLGNVLQQKGELEEAAAVYRQALERRPDFADAAYNLGNVSRDLGESDEAVAAYSAALRAKPDYAEARNNLANVYEERGQPSEAVAHVREALRVRPGWAPSLFTLAELAANKHCEFPQDEMARLSAALDDKSLSLRDSSQAHFAIALLRDKSGAHDDAFEFYRRGNAIKRQSLEEEGQAFDRRKHRDFVEQIIAAFDRGFFERVREADVESELPVFIVGMPRSGTTLVEQILASHPKVHGGGEMRDAGRLVDRLPTILNAPEGFPKCVAKLDRPAIRPIAEDYLQRLQRLGGPAHRVTDKAIANFLYVGLLKALFPRARFIHCRRDARDVCLSCYFQYFRELNFTWDLEDLGSYYRNYERLMRHWAAALPAPPLEVVYEDLVANQEAVSRQMIAHCGLEWDERCLAFHDNRRAVQTMSKMQVRQPIYSTSVARWKRYEAHLSPLMAALAGQSAGST